MESVLIFLQQVRYLFVVSGRQSIVCKQCNVRLDENSFMLW